MRAGLYQKRQNAKIKWIRELTKVTDIIFRVKKLNWNWRGTFPEEMMPDR